MNVKEKIKTAIGENRINDAVGLINGSGRKMQDDPDIVYFKSTILLMQNNVEAAGGLLEAALAKHPTHPYLAAGMASVLENKKEIVKALELYVRAEILIGDTGLKSSVVEAIERLSAQAGSQIQLHPLYVQNYVRALQDLFIAGDTDGIMRVSAEALSRYEGVGYFHFFAGIGCNHIGDFDQALENHRKAIGLDKTLADYAFKKCVAQPSYDEKECPCIGCGHTDHRVAWVGNQSVSESGFGVINPIRRWVRCTNCGLFYASPIPGEDALQSYYSLAAKEKYQGIYGDIDEQFDRLVNMYNHILFKIERYHRREKTVLDIGTGIGTFVGVAQDRGWDATGIELTPEDCDYAKRIYGLDIQQKNFNEFKEDEIYAVVTLFEVIEHLARPLADLKRINRLVATDGILVVATPIQDSLYGKRMQRKGVFWNTVGHLSYFPRATLVDYLNQAGFELLEINLSPRGQGRMEFYCRKIREITALPWPA